MGKECQAWGHMCLIPALGRQEAGGSGVQNQPGLHEILPPKESKTKNKAEDVAQWAEQLHSAWL